MGKKKNSKKNSKNKKKKSPSTTNQKRNSQLAANNAKVKQTENQSDQIEILKEDKSSKLDSSQLKQGKNKPNPVPLEDAGSKNKRNAQKPEKETSVPAGEPDQPQVSASSVKYLVGLLILILVGLFGWFTWSGSNTAKLSRIPLPQLSASVKSNEAEVEFQTSAGNIQVRLFPKYAPNAVENFLSLTKQGYYNNNQFFRVSQDNGIIQAGDPANNGTGNTSLINGNQPFPLEVSTSLYNIYGSLALANSGDGTNSSQFFFNANPKNMAGTIAGQGYPPKIEKAYKKGGNPGYDGRFTVFGQITKGKDVMTKIYKGEVSDNDSGEKSKPASPVTITGIKIIKDWSPDSK